MSADTATHHPHPSPARTVASPEHASLLRLATRWSVATAGVLIAVKLVAWLVTGSVSLLASLVDSTMDALASLLNLLAVRYALEPADAEHRFGHGKAESLAGLAQAAFIAGSAVFLGVVAIDRLIQPVELERTTLGIGVMAFSMAATLVLLAVQRHVIQRTASVAIRGDALHYVADLVTNAGVLIAIALSAAGWVRADALIGLVLAVYIFRSALQVGFDAMQMLLDRELPEGIQREILDIARGHEGVQGVHELRTRQSGPTKFIQLHLELDGSMTLARAHGIAVAVERRILEAYPEAEVLIHQDPEADEVDQYHQST